MTKVQFPLGPTREPAGLLRRYLREYLPSELLELSELEPRLPLCRCMAAALTAATLPAAAAASAVSCAAAANASAAALDSTLTLSTRPPHANDAGK